MKQFIIFVRNDRYLKTYKIIQDMLKLLFNNLKFKINRTLERWKNLSKMIKQGFWL